MLHEIKGHIDLEHELHELNDNIVQRRMEREANEIMADKLIDEYIQSCTTRPTYVDVEAFIDQRKLSNDLYTYIDISFRNILA